MDPAPTLEILHYLFSEDESGITAHCLELDLATCAPDRRTAESRLNAMVRVHVAGAFCCGNHGLLHFSAPLEFWAALTEAESLPTARLRIDTNPPRYVSVEQKMRGQSAAACWQSC